MHSCSVSLSFSLLQMCGHLAKSLLKFQNEPARLVLIYTLLTCVRFNASFTWKLSSSVCRSAAVRNGDKELCAEGMSWNTVWRVQLPEKAELAAQAHCCCKGLPSSSLVLALVFVQLHRELVWFVNAWENFTWWNVDCCAGVPVLTGTQRWHLGTSREQSCKEWAVWPWQGFSPVVLDRV